jgi:hypothetical protein
MDGIFFNIPSPSPEEAMGLMVAAAVAIPDADPYYWPGSVMLWGPPGQGKTAWAEQALPRLYAGAGALLMLAWGRGIPPEEVLAEGGWVPGPEDLREAADLLEGASLPPSLRAMARVALRAYLSGRERLLEEIGRGRPWRRLVRPVTAVCPSLEVPDLLGVLAEAVRGGEAVTVWRRPAWLPREGQGVLVLDDFPASPRAEVARAAANLLQFAALSGARDPEAEAELAYRLPPYWQVVGTGNRPRDVGGLLRIPEAPVRNRSLQILIAPPEEESVPLFPDERERARAREWAAGQAPDRLRYAREAGWPAAITAYLALWPEMAAVPAAVDGVERAAFPTWRSWELAAWVLRALSQEAARVPSGAERAWRLAALALEAAVGREAASDFRAVIGPALASPRLPDPEEIRTDPEGAPVPAFGADWDAARPAAIWVALEAAAAAAYRAHARGESAVPAARYLIRAAEEIQRAIQAGAGGPMDHAAAVLAEIARMPGQDAALLRSGVLEAAMRIPALRAAILPSLGGRP